MNALEMIRVGFLRCGGQSRRAARFCSSARQQVALRSALFGTHSVPLRKSSDVDWVSVSTTIQSSCGLKRNEDLYCWGANDFGQLGTGDFLDRSAPVRISQ